VEGGMWRGGMWRGIRRGNVEGEHITGSAETAGLLKLI